MSQEKVDLKKAEKAGRKKQNKKDKVKKNIAKCAVGLVVIGLAVWVGISVFNFAKKKTNSNENITEVNMNSLQNYMQEVEESINGTEEDAE